MRIRAALATALMVSVMVASQGHHFCATTLGQSAETFCRYFQALREESLNPVERFVFSLMLARTKAQQGSPKRGA